MRKTTKTDEKLKITVKRPDGEIEVVYKTDSVRYIGTVERVQAQIITATRDAGRGDIQLFQIVEEEIPMSIEEIRESIVDDISNTVYAQDDARDRDFDNDIGFHESVKFDSKISELRAELVEFDIKNPEILAEIQRLKEIRIQRSIQSALNS